jgi:integrase
MSLATTLNKRPDPLYNKLALRKYSTGWYVEYYHWNDNTETFERVRVTGDLNRKSASPTEVARAKNFKLLFETIKEELEQGYNPFDEVNNEEIKKSKIVLSLNDAKELYEADKKRDVRPVSMVSYMNALKLLFSAIGEDTLITDVSSITIRKAMLHLEQNSKTGVWRNSSFNNYKLRIGNFFDWLVQNKYLQVNPVKDIKLKITQTSETHEIITDDDMELILNYLDKHSPQTALFCRMIYFACIRPSELRKLKVKHVDMSQRKITVPDSIAKNKTTGYVYIDDELYDNLLLVKLDECNKEYHLFGNTHKTYTGAKGFAKETMLVRFNNCLKALELTGKNYTLYSFKHTTNMKRVQADWPLRAIMNGNRHKSIAQTEIYLRGLQKLPPTQLKVPSMFKRK